MPHTLSNDSNGHGVVVTLSGVVNGGEIYALNEELMANESFPRWGYQIWDFSNVEKFDASLDQLRAFAIQDWCAAQKNPHQRIAIIPRKFPRSGLDNVFHILESVWGAYESRSFPDVDAARQWADGG